jgi:glutathione synthase/RimK-type ligase-like ATP-grasp enzyme
MILLLTRRDDLTADYLILRLRERGIEYLRFDVDHYLKDTTLTATWSSIGMEGEVRTPQGTAPIAAIKAVFYRRAMTPDFRELDMSEGDRWFAEREARHYLEGTLGALPVRWVNPWSLVHKWERKLLQLPLASQCGLQIPETIVASDSARLLEFSRSQSIVVKAIAQGFVGADKEVESVYTHAISDGRLGDEFSARLCPTLLQQRIAKVADIRLTVVGKHQFAARLDADLPDRLDWRRPHTDIRYSTISVPASIATAVAKMLETMGLLYGAFDFALSEDGTWIFLEVNPTGEFAWIENELGFPLRDSLIDELLSLDKSNDFEPA